VELRDVLARTLVRPAWEASGPKIETWTCRACGRRVERTSPAWKGIWFAAGPDEVVALCARVHRAHDRKGVPVAVDEEPLGDDAWVPIVAVDAGDPPPSFVALVPPAGVAFVLDGDAYELRRLDELRPGDLVGPRAAARLGGDVIGRIPVASLDLDPVSCAVRLD
jgi:hypothetical protein